MTKHMHVVSLFDHTTIALQPWANAGFECHAYDIAHVNDTRRGNITVHQADLYDAAVRQKVRKRHAGRCVFVFAFPPCTDLSIAGARWFARKRKANPRFMEDAAQRVIETARLCESLGGRYVIENPKSSRLNVLWRKFDHAFNPFDYGGYIKGRGAHPLWPDKIPAYDAYHKPTGLWTSTDFVMPPVKPVEPVWTTFTSGARQRRISPIFYGFDGTAARNATPRGFANAVYVANAPAPLPTGQIRRT